VERTAQKSLPLILAREFASNLATPLSILDEEGALVFFNEPAERIIGRSHAEVGVLSEEEWRQHFRAQRPDGSPVGDHELPVTLALRERRPAHGTLAYTMLDGRLRTLSVTAIPMLGRGEELAGIVVVFWEADGA
jgi:PAS domain-containing protein